MTALNEELDRKIKTAQVEAGMAAVELARKERKLFNLRAERFGVKKAEEITAAAKARGMA